MFGPPGPEAFSSERKRSHTAQGCIPSTTIATTTVPSISLLVISNAEAVFSHRRQHTAPGQMNKAQNMTDADVTKLNTQTHCVVGNNNSKNVDCHVRYSSSSSGSGNGSGWFSAFNMAEKNNHYRTSSQASTLVGSGSFASQFNTPGREFGMVFNHRHQSVITSPSDSAWKQHQRFLQEHDGRRRTITDPMPRTVSASPLSTAKFKLLSPFYNYPKESRLSLKLTSPEAAQLRLDHALGVRTSSSPSLRPSHSVDCHDKLTKGGHDSSLSGSRSSLTPLYSGYIWLYIPNIPEAPVQDGSTVGSRGNICITKASGRYVKCYATINDKGQLQWVEVKKQQGLNETGTREGGKNKTGRRSSSRPSYAVQLTSQPRRPSVSIEGAPTSRPLDIPTPQHGDTIEVLSSPEPNLLETSNSQQGAESGTRTVQASMAHKLRLYFFCIKISPASLAEVMSEMTTAAAGTASLKSMPSKEWLLPPTKTNNCGLNGSIGPLTAIVPPPRTTSLPFVTATTATGMTAPVKDRGMDSSPPKGFPEVADSLLSRNEEQGSKNPRARSDTMPEHRFSLLNSRKFPTWPSMSPLHSEKSRSSRMMKMGRNASTSSFSSATSTAYCTASASKPLQSTSLDIPRPRQQELHPPPHISTVTSFERERTVSAPPGSYRASQLGRHGLSMALGRHDSISSSRTILQQHSAYSRSGALSPVPAAIMASHRALTGAKNSVSKDGTARVLSTSISAPSLAKSSSSSPSSSPSSPLLAIPSPFSCLDDVATQQEEPPLLESSTVVSLAQDLQKAMLTRQRSTCSRSSDSTSATSSNTSSSSSSSSTAQNNALLPNRDVKVTVHESLGTAHSTLSTSLASPSIFSHRESQQPKLTLSETMAIKRASLQSSSSFLQHQQLEHKASLTSISNVQEEEEEEEEDEEEEEEEQGQDARSKVLLSEGCHGKDLQQQRQVLKLMCPFLEQSEQVDAQGRTFVTLKGYIETEEAWKNLQNALERFIDGPISDQRSALPPEDTLIPSYNSPPIPEIRQSERAQNFWNAKQKLTEAAFMASMLAHNTTFTTTTTTKTTTTTSSFPPAFCPAGSGVDAAMKGSHGKSDNPFGQRSKRMATHAATSAKHKQGTNCSATTAASTTSTTVTEQHSHQDTTTTTHRKIGFHHSLYNHGSLRRNRVPTSATLVSLPTQ
ncbi:hypothetical protein BGZ94_002306 [Podila epigama]|nr:hypothetical protein BGZ94_002306 [Podila epigama]